MHRFNGQDSLSNVKPGLLLTQNVLVNQERHQVPALQKLHDQIQKLLILKRALQLHNPRVILRNRQNVALSLDMLLLVFVDHLGLLHFFDRHDFFGLAVAADADFSKGATADNLEWLIVLHRDFRASVCELGFICELTGDGRVLLLCAGFLV